MTVEQAVKNIASRMFWDYRAWKQPTHGQDPDVGYSCMNTGLYALIQFGFASDYVWDNGNNPNYKRIQDTLERLWNENPLPPSDPNRIPTKEDVAASAAWARHMEDLLFQEFSPGTLIQVRKCPGSCGGNDIFGTAMYCKECVENSPGAIHARKGEA
jgi:hypothetical protein